MVFPPIPLSRLGTLSRRSEGAPAFHYQADGYPAACGIRVLRQAYLRHFSLAKRFRLLRKADTLNPAEHFGGIWIQAP